MRRSWGEAMFLVTTRASQQAVVVVVGDVGRGFGLVQTIPDQNRSSRLQ